MLKPEHENESQAVLVVAVVVGTRDGSCFYGEAMGTEDFGQSFSRSSTGGIPLRLNNCQMMLAMGPGTKGWFDLAGRGPDAQCLVSPPVDCAVIAEVTKILSCSKEAASRWKVQGTMGPSRIVTARNQ